jgi:hypothetical protein
MSGVLRVGADPGLLTNVRMSLEIGCVLAHLTGRRLSQPFEQPLGAAPQSSIGEHDQGRPAGVLDLFEVPVATVHPDEWHELAGLRADVHEWGEVGDSVIVCDGEVDLENRQLIDFANGRSQFRTIPRSDAPVLRIDGRLLAFYSYLFYAPPAQRRLIRSLVGGVRLRRPYRELASTIAADLPGRFNALHLRRSDLTGGIPAYGGVTPETIADNLASVLPTDELLVVCSEVDERDELFDPLRSRFGDIVWVSNLILRDHAEAFFSLPRHEDNALGVVTQEVAARSGAFVGTIGSTFTGMIQRMRLLREPQAKFLYTADFTPPGPTFANGEFVETAEGSYSWNRIGLAISPGALAWFREWPEAA